MKQVRYGFTLWKKKGVRFLTIPSFERAGGLTCAMSTRVGGVSKKPYDTLNFSQAREQSQESFEQNMQRFSDSVGFNYKNAIANNYEHAANLKRAAIKDAGRGVVKEKLSEYCDGLYTDVSDLPLITFHADCAPLFFYDPQRKAIAVCHAGWKGVSQHIIKNAVKSLTDMGSDADQILAAVGPCISANHFEVQQDVSSVFEETFGSCVLVQKDSRMFIDLPKACVIDMVEAGIVPSNITLSDLCTYENERLFFSHRRDNGKTGAMAAVMQLNAQEI